MLSIRRQPFGPSMEKLIHFLSLFGILPWHNFKGYSLFRPQLFRCYASMLSFALASLSMWLIIVRYHDLYNAKFSTELICDIFLEVESLITVLLVILGAAYWNISIWKELWDLQSRDDMSNKLIQRNVFFLRHSKAIFILGHMFLIFLYCMQMQMHFTNKVVYVPWYYYAANSTLTYYEFLTAFAIVCVAASIKSRYVFINRLFNAYNYKHVSLVKHIRNVKRLWLYVDGIVDCFNQLFGWPLMLIFLDFVADILSSLILSVIGTYIWDHIDSVNTGAIVLNIIYLLQSGVWLATIIFCCDSVVKEANKLLTNCYRLEQSLPLFSKELEELESLKKLIKNKTPKLTAADFFEIRRSTLLSLLSTTTTYFIVALQFNSL